MRSLPGLGDFLCAIPALRALRGALPQAEITLIGLPNTRSLVERFSDYIDEFLEFPGFPGIPEVVPQIDRLPAFFASHQRRFDLALQMHGSGIISNQFTVLLGARMNAGFYLRGHYCPDENSFLPYPEHEPEVWRNGRLMEFLGIPLVGTDLEWKGRKEDFDQLDGIAQTRNITREYVCIHPGASVCDRRWEAEKFAAVADALSDRFQVVLTGTLAETEVTQTVLRAMRSAAIDLAGKTSLGALAALLSKAALLICNDTGVSHLAAALGVKSVVIFSNSDPNRWAPLNRDPHRILSTSSITPEAVMAEVDLLIKEVMIAG